jgi:CRISPR-associated protein Cas1
VKSGDPDNYEARAAAYYWENLFEQYDTFRRHRHGDAPNNLLNYGYAILRAIVARALVGSGLFTALGIHHKNKYNPYCLADDIMEPYRPYVDALVLELIKECPEIDELTTPVKAKLLGIATVDVQIDRQSSPLMVGVQRTTASLRKCFEGETRKIIYPVL